MIQWKGMIRTNQEQEVHDGGEATKIEWSYQFGFGVKPNNCLVKIRRG